MYEMERPDGYLERLAESDAARSYKRQMLELLSVGRGQTAVDLGCGPGVDLRSLAEATGGEGTVVGVDRDPQMLVRARQRLAGQNVDARLCLADVRALPFGDGTIDRARTDRVLQHVDDLPQTLAEIRRVLRAGGRVVFGEPDWDTLVIDYEDRHVAHAYRQFITEHVIRNPGVGHELPRLTEHAGLHVTAVVAATQVFRDVKVADLVFGLGRVTRRAVDAGYLAGEDAQAWLTRLAREPFLLAVTFFAVVATSG